MVKYGIPRRKTYGWVLEKYPNAVATHSFTKEELEDLYIRQQLSLKAIGEKYGVSATCIEARFREHHIPLRKPWEYDYSKYYPTIPKETIQTLYEAGYTAEKIGNQFGVDKKSILARMRKYGIPIRHDRSPSIKTHPPTFELGYVVGTLKGDGWVGKKSFALKCKDGEFVDYFIECISRLTKHITKVSFKSYIVKNKDGRKYHYFSCRRRKFCRWYGRLTNEKIKWIAEKNRRFLVGFLKGFYDSEGCLSLSKCFVKGNWYYYPRIHIYNTEKKLIDLVCAFIKGLEIECVTNESAISTSGFKSNKEKVYIIRINKVYYARKFLTIVGSSIPRKSLARFQSYLEENPMKFSDFRFVKKEKLQKMYCEETKTLKEIGETFGVSADAVWHRFIKLGIPRRTNIEICKIRRQKKTPILGGSSVENARALGLSTSPSILGVGCRRRIR